METKSEVERRAVPTGDPSKVLQGMRTIFEGMQMMLDGILEQTELSGGPARPADESASIENKEQNAKAALPMTETERTASATKAQKGTRYKIKKAVSEKPAVKSETQPQTEKAETPMSTDPEEDDVLPFEKAPIDETPENDAAPTESNQTSQSSPSGQPEQEEITLDTLTKVVVAKIKKDRGNSDRINQLVNSFGVSQLSSLPTEKYEAFLSSLSDL